MKTLTLAHYTLNKLDLANIKACLDRLGATLSAKEKPLDAMGAIGVELDGCQVAFEDGANEGKVMLL